MSRAESMEKAKTGWLELRAFLDLERANPGFAQQYKDPMDKWEREDKYLERLRQALWDDDQDVLREFGNCFVAIDHIFSRFYEPREFDRLIGAVVEHTGYAVMWRDLGRE